MRILVSFLTLITISGLFAQSISIGVPGKKKPAVTKQPKKVLKAKPKAKKNCLIISFNGKKCGKIKASTKNKAFKAAFEKELKKIASKIKGNPKFEISHWYTIINGGAIRWDKPAKDNMDAVIAALQKLPFVKYVEKDQMVSAF